MIPVDTIGMIQSRCEFCGLMFWIDDENFAVLHTEPMCSKFESLEILDFLKENREIKTARNN